MASLVVLILSVWTCCAMAAPAAPATMPIMILRRWDEGGLEEEWCDMRYSFRALLVVVLVRDNQRTQRASKRVERPARCHRKRTAYECSACDFFSLPVFLSVRSGMENRFCGAAQQYVV